MSAQSTPAAVLTAPDGEGTTSHGAELATIRSVAPDGTPTLELGRAPHVAPGRFAVSTTRERVEAAIVLRQPVVVVFERGDRTRPIVVGFLESLAPTPPVVPGDHRPSEHPVVEADVDGRRVRVTAQDEIVLECGKASITLRRNGRVIIRGTYLESRSDGTNRIKGGQVQIN